MTSLAGKLQMTEAPIRIVDAPPELDLGIPTAVDAAGLLVFVRNRLELLARRGEVLQTARSGHLCWIAYPKGGQLGTDLNRDTLWKELHSKGVRPVRQVSIDSIWSALRFRPTPDA